MHPNKSDWTIAAIVTTALLLAACAPQDSPGLTLTAAPAQTVVPQEESGFQPIMIDTISYAPGQDERRLFLDTGGDADTELVELAAFPRLAIRSGNREVLPAEDDNITPDSFIQFRVGDEILFQGLPTDRVMIEVEYLDEGTDWFKLEYDAVQGAFTIAGAIDKTGSGQVRTAVFSVCDAYFANRTNGADFRISDFGDGPETIFSVTVRLLPTPEGSERGSDDGCGTIPPDDQPDSQADPSNSE